MKQVVFCSRFSRAVESPILAASSDPRFPAAPAQLQANASPLLDRIKAARVRHSACGVSSLLVRHGECLLGILEGSPAYVDRMMAALAADGLLGDLRILDERVIRDREYSQLALCLVEVETLQPRPAWAAAGLAHMDLRTVRRALKGLRAFHGLHAEPVRSSHLYTVEASLGNR